ncbi:MAG: DUF2147 domain-containing protein [Brevinemataceae bacterium]
MKLLKFATMLFLISPIYAEINADDITGLWIMQKSDAGDVNIADIFKKNGKYYAYAFVSKDKQVKHTLDVNNPDPNLRSRSLGEVVFLYDLVFQNGSWGNGEIYNPDSGKYFFLKGSLSKDKKVLTWRASIDSAGVFGKTMRWKRVDNPEEFYRFKPKSETIEKNIPSIRYKI